VEKKYVKPSYVAQELNVDLTTVQRWCREGKLDAFQTPGGHWKISLESAMNLKGADELNSTTVNLTDLEMPVLMSGVYSSESMSSDDLLSGILFPSVSTETNTTATKTTTRSSGVGSTSTTMSTTTTQDHQRLMDSFGVASWGGLEGRSKNSRLDLDSKPKGFTGSTGSVGPCGPQGLKGSFGPPGVQGCCGPTGPSGGPTGPTGPVGPIGDKSIRSSRLRDFSRSSFPFCAEEFSLPCDSVSPFASIFDLTTDE
jgi:excisionase family DNA binding protein